MGRSRASKDQLMKSGCMPRRQRHSDGDGVESCYSDGGGVNRNMKNVLPKKGAGSINRLLSKKANSALRSCVE